MISFISHLISEASYCFTKTDHSDRNLTLVLPMNTDYIGMTKKNQAPKDRPLR